MSAAPAHVDYPKPPIIEMLCQITFQPVAWSAATPGLLWGELKNEYPVDPVGQQQVQAQVVAPQGAVPGGFAVNTASRRVVYASADSLRLSIASPETISVNSLAPYEGWNAVEDRFGRAVLAYQQVCGGLAVQHVTVKYVNRVILPPAVDPSDYFNVPLWTTGQDSSRPDSVIQRIEAPIEPDVLLVASFGTLAEPDSAWLLDLEVRASGLPANASLRDIVALARLAHDAENAEFERSITDLCRELFQ